MKMKTFNVKLTVNGNLLSHFVFETDKDADSWMETDFQKLCSKYGKLQVNREKLPGLKVGDKCNVWGEGIDIFCITGIRQYSPHRFGFILDNGVCEEVAKCHTEHLGN